MRRWRTLVVLRWLAIMFAACSSAVPGYPLHPTVRSASGGPIHVSGAIERPGDVPYSTGLLLTCAMRLVGGPTRMAAGFAEISRLGRHFSVPIIDIINGSAPDLELAPGDAIEIIAMR